MRDIYISGTKAYSYNRHNMICILNDYDNNVVIYDINSGKTATLKHIKYPNHIAFNKDESFMYIGTTTNYIHVIDINTLKEVKKIRIDTSNFLTESESDTFEISQMVFSTEDDIIVITGFCLCKDCILLYSIVENKIIFLKTYDSEEVFVRSKLFNVCGHACIVAPSEINRVNKNELLFKSDFYIEKEVLISEPTTVYRIQSFSKRKRFSFEKSLEFVTSDELYFVALAFNKIYIFDVKANEWIRLNCKKIALVSTLSFKYIEAEKLLAIIINREERIVIVKLDSKNCEDIREFKGYSSCCFLDESLFLLKDSFYEDSNKSILLEYKELFK